MVSVDTAKLVRETLSVPRKTPRPPGPDDWAAERVRFEREQRGWSTAELARRVTLAGVPMRQQTVWKVESGQPRRSLSVGEASAFANVFGISLRELMTPPRVVLTDLMKLASEFIDWRRDAGTLFGRLVDIARQVDALGAEDVFDAETVSKFFLAGDDGAEWAISQL